ncbi:MAG: LPS-assembly protein LptD [Burkholderiales bacterium]|nr:LPS-assembly protein LptD [Burkholderiales bacterium]
MPIASADFLTDALSPRATFTVRPCALAVAAIMTTLGEGGWAATPADAACLVEPLAALAQANVPSHDPTAVQPRVAPAAQTASGRPKPLLPPAPAYCASAISSNGSYPLQLQAPVPGKKEAATITATESQGADNDHVLAIGDVDMRSPSKQVLADWMRYDFAIDTLTARGNVAIRTWQDLVTGPELQYRRDTATGYMKQPTFVLGLYKGRGKADEMQFTGPQQYRVQRGNYTTCVGESPAWRIEVGELDLNENTSIGVARDAKVYLGDIPVAWLPQFSFPLRSERKSGFLAATYGTSGNRGFDLQLPYYFNLAPNYDATLTPRIMTKRGVLFNGQARYLFDTPFGRALGEWNGEILPKDKLAGMTRDATNIRHTQFISPNLTLQVNYNHVSDSKYFVDLADYVSITSVTTLPRDATLTYRNGEWLLTARAQRFQTLQDPGAVVLPPYDRMPQLTAESPVYKPLANHPLELKLMSDLTRFEYPNGSLPSGYRSYAYGTATWRYDTPGLFVIPKLALHVSNYKLVGSFDDYANSTRVLPIASVDSGLRFERNTSLFGKAFQQTLEPRAMFTYIPYRDQSQTPVFDTALADFNELQLFSENRYIGQDRIGDATQLALGLTSRLFDADSQKERLRLTIGERFYFNNQRVTLGETARDRNSLDLLLSVRGRLTDALYVEGNTQFDANLGRTERFAVGLRYSPDRSRTLNLNYRSIRELITLTGPVGVKQVDVSGQWPIYRNLYAVGRLNYSIADRHTTESVIGLEYDGCCFVLRAVAQRITTSTTTATTAAFLQLELNGLGRVGPSPLDVLKRNIPGYSMLYENPTRRRLDETPSTGPMFTPWNPATP